MAAPQAKSGRGQMDKSYRSLEDDGTQMKKGLLDRDDPFGDPFGDDNDTPYQERPRMECEANFLALAQNVDLT